MNIINGVKTYGRNRIAENGKISLFLYKNEVVTKLMEPLADIAISASNTIIVCNNTPHASRQICAPWGVTFFRGAKSALH
jgi:hypothetical protein